MNAQNRRSGAGITERSYRFHRMDSSSKECILHLGSMLLYRRAGESIRGNMGLTVTTAVIRPIQICRIGQRISLTDMGL